MNKKADMGIGTLILFIAMIIVASITANVLIQTATSLQNQALKTGNQAQKSISTIAQTIGVIGSNATDHTVEDFELELKLAPGSDAMDLTKAMLSLDLEDGGTSYIYSDEGCQFDSSQTGSGTGYFVNTTYHNGTFGVKYLVKGAMYSEGYLQRGDIIKICFASENSIGEDRDVEIRYTPAVGMPTVISFVTKDVMTNYRIKLYP